MSPRPPGPILIVEDEIFVALELEQLLADGGYGICAIAADHEEAIGAAPDCAFAFVDVNLRDGATGPRIARELWKRFGIRSIFVTANPGQIGEGIDGALAYVRKPFDREAILAAAAWAASPQGRPANDNVVPLGSVSSSTGG
ncbi:MAG: response regulator [Sphingomonadaceae bacterium]|nr:response regulator [Sphingomonadaceae bacterium]